MQLIQALSGMLNVSYDVCLIVQIRKKLAKHWISLLDLGNWEMRKAAILFIYPLLITLDLAVFNPFR